MADPRLTVNYEGIDYEAAPYKTDGTTIVYDKTQFGGSAGVGKAVALSAARTVKLAADGDAIEGKLIQVESDGIATVQFDGFMTLPGGNGASLTLGKKVVGALDAGTNPGFIRETNTATPAENGKCRGAIIDASDTANVIVRLS